MGVYLERELASGMGWDANQFLTGNEPTDAGLYTMDHEFFERLLYEEESTTLDFKREQYPFAKATDEDKSELLKDILGFANAWRRSSAYILIGVDDVRGGQAVVCGINPNDHLDDHSLQQFVNSLTNRAVRFTYEAFGYRGKQVGVISIEQQPRPLFLKRDFGKLKKGDVYVRRGSSTDPTRPADADEIASMGVDHASARQNPSLSIHFACLESDDSVGEQLELQAEFCQMPDRDEIPVVREHVSTRLGELFVHPYQDELNPRYLMELAEWMFFERLARKTRMVVTNTGRVVATDVRLEFAIPLSQKVVAFESADAPPAPKRRTNRLTDSMRNVNFRPLVKHPGNVQIRRTADHTKIEINCMSLQPGRSVWTDDFFVGVLESGLVRLDGYAYASNLEQPQPVALTINAIITQSELTLEVLRTLGER